MSKLTEALEEHLKIINSWEFARIGGARIYISYGHNHAHALGYTDPRAAVMRWVQDRRTFVPEKVFRLPYDERGTYAQTRDRSYEMARTWVDGNYKLMEWKRTPYLDAWVPASSYERVLAKLEEARS